MNSNTLPTPEILSRITAQLRLLEQSYSIKLWHSDTHRGDWLHDLSLMHHHQDLSRLTLRLLDKHDRITLEAPFEFAAGQSHQSRMAAVEGLELPLLRPGTVARGELIITRRGYARRYDQQMRLSWAAAREHAQPPTRQYASEHVAKITGGRVRGSFRVTKAVEHLLEVVQTGTQGFAFGRDVNGTLDRVFLHPRYVDSAHPQLRFHSGQRVRALVVQTSKGLQARSIRPV